MRIDPDDYTLEELQDKARDADIHGRSSMDKQELADALSDDEAEASADLGANRPEQGELNPKLAPVPPVADQPGLGRPANEPVLPGPPVGGNGVERVGAEIDRRREIDRQNREAAQN